MFVENATVSAVDVGEMEQAQLEVGRFFFLFLLDSLLCFCAFFFIALHFAELRVFRGGDPNTHMGTDARECGCGAQLDFNDFLPGPRFWP